MNILKISPYILSEIHEHKATPLARPLRALLKHQSRCNKLCKETTVLRISPTFRFFALENLGRQARDFFSIGIHIKRSFCKRESGNQSTNLFILAKMKFLKTGSLSFPKFSQRTIKHNNFYVQVCKYCGGAFFGRCYPLKCYSITPVYMTDWWISYCCAEDPCGLLY